MRRWTVYLVLVAAIAAGACSSGDSSPRSAAQRPAAHAAPVEHHPSVDSGAPIKAGMYVVHVDPNADPEAVANWMEQAMPAEAAFTFTAMTHSAQVNLTPDTPEVRARFEREVQQASAQNHYVIAVQRCPCG